MKAHGGAKDETSLVCVKSHRLPETVRYFRSVIPRIGESDRLNAASRHVRSAAIAQIASEIELPEFAIQKAGDRIPY
jgi:hypothetical protein